MLGRAELSPAVPSLPDRAGFTPGDAISPDAKASRRRRDAKLLGEQNGLHLDAPGVATQGAVAENHAVTAGRDEDGVGTDRCNQSG